MTKPKKQHRLTKEEILAQNQIPEEKLGPISKERPSKEKFDRMIEKLQRKWAVFMLNAWEDASGVRLRKTSRKFLVESMIAHAMLSKQKSSPTR